MFFKRLNWNCQLKQIIVTSIILFSASICNATGWNDYSLDIGDGYTVFRANSLDISIGKANGRLILHHADYENVGPVIRYIITPEHILTKNYGRKNRNLFEGDTFQEVDTSQEYYFIISKKSDMVTGPLSEDQFVKRQEVSSLDSLDWKKPKNPNFLIPLLGSLMFIIIIIPILLVKYFWITVPVFIGVVLLIRYLMRNLKVSGSVPD